MAIRRCISGKITESDWFYALPANAQALYLHLNMQADDDGFLNNAAGVAGRLPGGREALKKLVEQRFLLKFGEIYVVKHWRIANSLKNDRIRPLNYAAVAQRIWVKENRAYTDHPGTGWVTLYALRMGKEDPPGIQSGENRIPDGFQKGENRIPDGFQKGENRIPDGFQNGENWNPFGIQNGENRIPDGIQNGQNWIPKRKEEKRKEENGKEDKEAPGVWEEILRLYPRQKIGNREGAYDAFCRCSDAEGRQMVESLRLWISSEQWKKEGGRYIPYLENWILRGAWQEKPEKMALPVGASGQLGEAELEAIQRVLGMP